MAREKLTNRQRRLVRQAQKCGLLGFCDGVNSKPWGVARVLRDAPEECVEEMEAAIQQLTELTLSLRSTN